jgi:hypothetical protein
MNHIRAFILGITIPMSSCVTPHKEQPIGPTKKQETTWYAIGPWTNIYEDDPELAGVEIHQQGENPYEQAARVGKHPEMILYYFWDGRIRQQNFDTDGSVYSDQWLPKLKIGDPSWELVDFSSGSDPSFSHHRDPRPPKAQQDAAANP